MHRARSRAKVAEQVEGRLTGRGLETQGSDSLNDLLPLLVRITVGKTLFVIVETDQDRCRPSPSFDDDRLTTLLELAQNLADRLPHLQRIHTLHDRNVTHHVSYVNARCRDNSLCESPSPS